MSASRFIEHSVNSVVRALARAMEAERLAQQSGLLQRLDARVKAAGLTTLIIAAVISHRISVILCIFAAAVLMALLSRIPVSLLAKRLWIGVLLFTTVIAIPALFTTPGQPIAHIHQLRLAVTYQGLRSAVFLITRTETAATLAFLLVVCTPWTQVLKTLRSFYLPVTLVAILGMTHRYIFLLLETARDMFESRQSRTVGVLDGAQQRRIALRTAGVLMDKSLRLSNDVYMAMRSRGYSGEVHTLSQFKLGPADYIALFVFVSASAAAFWAGR